MAFRCHILPLSGREQSDESSHQEAGFGNWGTGAQSQAVVKALLEPAVNGAPSPYVVRILTRNPDHPKVKAEFNHPNIELVERSFTDLAKVERALESAWGAYINLDGSYFARGAK